ncbi:MAG: aspartate/glutamate racemase family protein [Gammaproteobacteria bacterium]|nr:aspartate/glutamate racemase family protein [Gammaproteobacteria bacterium]
MRILLINPNVTEAVTELMLDEARRSARPGTTLEAATARFGVEYVATRIEAQVAGHAVLEAIAEHGDDADGIIIAAFGDPGLLAARELARVPVVGIAEAALHVAYLCSTRFSIVCLNERLARWYAECAAEHDLDRRLVSVRPMRATLDDIRNARGSAAEALVNECHAAVEADGAELVIMGGGPIAGLARDVEDRIPVPVIDGVRCAVGLVEALVSIAPRQPRSGTLARPPGKRNIGLSPALAAFLHGDQVS